MATLAQIVAGGFNGVYPNPTALYIIRDFLMSDSLINGLEFVNNAVPDGTNGLITTIKYFDGSSEGQTRAFGENYQVQNEVPSKRYISLKAVGQTYNKDDAVDRNNPMFAQDAFELALTQSLITWNKYTVIGNSTTDAKQVDGILTQIPAGQKNSTPIQIGTLTHDVALQVMAAFNQAIAKMNGAPDFVLTDREGAAILATINGVLYNNTKVVKFSDKEYNEFLGARILVADNVGDTTDGHPVVFGRSGRNGVYISVSRDGQFVKHYTGSYDGNGQVVIPSTIDIVSAPVIANTKAVSQVLVKN